MKKILFPIVALLFLFSCNNDDDANNEEMQEEGTQVQAFFRMNCTSSIIQDYTFIYTKFYSTENLFDYTNRDLIETVSANSQGAFYTSIEEDGSYYFEVFDTDDNELFKGIFRIPEDLTEDGQIHLMKGMKTGVVREVGLSGPNIANAEIVHTEEITGEQYVTMSDQDGIFCVELNPGRYYVSVSHPDYETYTTEDGFSVFWSNKEGFSNFFLEIE